MVKAATKIPPAAAGRYEMNRLSRAKTPWLTTPVVVAAALKRRRRCKRVPMPSEEAQRSRQVND